ATASCNAGACSIACDNGFADCDNVAASGCESAVDADIKNCGACGRACGVFNGAPACKAGVCSIGMCTQGNADCDMDYKIGGDVNNCGACAMKCPVPTNTVPSCTNGACGIKGCVTGFGDCDVNMMNGCETDLKSPTNCGSCGVICKTLPNASAGCVSGMCG